MLAVSIPTALAAQVPVPVAPAFDPGKALSGALFSDLFGAQLAPVDAPACPATQAQAKPKDSPRGKEAVAPAANAAQAVPTSMPLNLATFNLVASDLVTCHPVSLNLGAVPGAAPIPLPQPIAIAPEAPEGSNAARSLPAADANRATTMKLEARASAATSAGAGFEAPSAMDAPVATQGIPGASPLDALAMLSQEAQQPQSAKGETRGEGTLQSDSAKLARQAAIPPVEMAGAPSPGAQGAAAAADGWSVPAASMPPWPAATTPASETPQIPSPAANGSGQAQGSASVNLKTLQDARADLKFLDVQAASNPQRPVIDSERASRQLAGEFAARPSATIEPASVLAAALPTKPIPAAAPSPALHEALQTQAASATPAATNGFPAGTSPGKGGSTGSPGNPSDSGPEHSSNASASRGEASAFNQSLEAAGPNAANAHAQPADASGAAADARASLDPHMMNAEAKSDSGAASGATEAAALPATRPAEQPMVSGARLADSAGQTEIRIEMQAGSLGAVELRAHISGDTIGASIAVEHHEAQLMLANDLPALHSALAEKNLSVNTLSVSQGMPTSSGMGHGGSGHSRAFAPFQSKAPNGEQAEPAGHGAEAAMEAAGTLPGGMRLSVLA